MYTQGLSTKYISPGTLRTKLTVGRPGDRYERQADQMADRVMSMPEKNTLRMQPEEEEEMVQMQPIEEEEEMIQPMPAKSDSGSMAPANISEQLGQNAGRGKKLDSSTNSFMQNRFGTDFSSVSVHTDAEAAGMNEQLHAQAFTYGKDIYFNQGKYQPSTDAGKKLLAHELTHVVQQGNGIRPMIQKNGDGESGESGSNTPLADLVAGILRDQLSNSSMQGHLRSLGTALQGLALETTTPSEGEAPQATPERLAALGIPRAFETTSAAILSDPSFRNFRDRLIEIVGSSDETALVTALAAALALVLADIPVTGSPSHDFGSGISVGGSFDLGSIRELQFNNASLYFQFARDHFRTRVTGSLSRDAETDEFSGAGTGEVRIGSDTSHLMGRVTINSDGEVVLLGRLSAGHSFGGSDRLIFTTDLSHSFSSGETIFRPGLSGRFGFGADQSLRLGSELVVSSESGVTGLTGFIEYRREHLQLRIEGSMTGLGEETGLLPGGDMRVQGTLTIPLW
ncbi:MAG: DUF4157 domain-containing protein [bacterium]|jgi:hypothetical protein